MQAVRTKKNSCTKQIPLVALAISRLLSRTASANQNQQSCTVNRKTANKSTSKIQIQALIKSSPLTIDWYKRSGGKIENRTRQRTFGRRFLREDVHVSGQTATKCVCVSACFLCAVRLSSVCIYRKIGVESLRQGTSGFDYLNVVVHRRCESLNMFIS